MNATQWTAVGSIGTAAAALIAVCAILIPLYVARRKDDNERAARLRDAVITFADSTTRLITMFQHGLPFSGAAAAITDYIREQLPESATMEDVWRFIEYPPNGIRAADVGLANAPVSAVTREQEAMQIMARNFDSVRLNSATQRGKRGVLSR